MLATAVIRIQVNDQISPSLRALCDTGAQINLISEQAAEKMRWSTQQCCVRLKGINEMTGKTHTRKLLCGLLSRFSEEPLISIELIIVPKILSTWLPHSPLPKNIVPRRLLDELADPGVFTPAPVDLLLGAGVWAAIIRNGSFSNEKGIAFQPSKLGWLVFGGGIHSQKFGTVHLATNGKVEVQSDELLRRFWEVEEVSLVRTRTTEQQQCEDIFMRTHRRLDNGRFQVDIPLRNDIEELGSSKAIALQRFRQLERRFQRDPILKEQYFKAINDLIQANQMRLTDRPPGPMCYHIPHHAVLKKFRIVNDASCPTDKGISLNEVQLIGEKLQDDLANLIMRFRCYPIAVTADIKKMYLQVQINPAQWDLQRIFWRPSSDNEILEYWLTVVTFGMASAPHCAVRAMIQGARDSRLQLPMGAEAIEHDFYMDDCLTGAEDVETAKRLCYEMDTCLRSCGFMLSKWRSNCRNVVPSDSGDYLKDEIELGEFDDTTVLGLRWLPKSDELMFKLQLPQLLSAQEATKRRVLSHIAKIFDPNGYIGPVVIVAKILMQKIWSSHIDWDTRLPDNLYREWQQFHQQLPLITETRLPRWIGFSKKRNISLHGFADASLLAYGAVLYMRIECEERLECRLIAAKSRVAPLKTITVPRLELCAAQLLSELINTFKSASRLSKIETTLWSDSQIVLAWLVKEASSLKIFVNNRVQKIHELAPDVDWRYVPSGDNPADLISRGTTATELQGSQLWWHGPSWLSRQIIYWPDTEPNLSSEAAKEMAKEERTSTSRSDNSSVRSAYKECLAMSITLRDVDLLLRASSAHKVFRLTAWIFRYCFNLRQRKERVVFRRTGPLKYDEIIEAQEYWIREEQAIYYAREIKALKGLEANGIDSSSPIFKCNPCLDSRGVLRLHGRLNKALIPQEQKNPVLLPDVSPLAILLIREAHERTMHGGPREMTAYLRRRFWITNLRRAIHTSNSKCIACVKEKQEGIQQMMGELPSDRVRPCRPFRHSGVDYAGPFLLKARGGRCNIVEKKYVAVFICMVTKAVHLELVDSLSTADFIQAFHCFTSIRGNCTRLWSDNGKNFIGAEKELAHMLRTWKNVDMAKKLLEYGTEWRFITPRAPHQGGLWEAAIKSMKYHLRRVIGPHKLTSSAFRTILAQTSAVMNSRPLSAQSDNPEDLSFLTPAHFLIGEPIIQPFGAFVQDIPENRLKLALQIQKMTQTFWKAWSQDYLNELQQRTKWGKAQSNIKEGELVLIREENTPPTLWKTARVIKVFPGADGLVRNVRLKVATVDWETKSQPLERPVQKLCRLPIDVEAETSRGQCVGAD